jgi:LysR family transcriptional activator of nhaA
MKAFGEAGAGVFPTPAAGVPDVTAHYQVVKLGETEEIRERFFLISAERRLTHPAARAVSENARARTKATSMAAFSMQKSPSALVRNAP